MYYYVYDSFVKKDKSAEKVLEKVNVRLTELDMLGETAEVTKIRDMKRLIEEGISKGHTTIIVIGDNRSLNQAINSILGWENVVLGTIPVGKDISIAKSLGLDDPERVADLLAARKVERLDLGVVNNRVFLSSLEFGLDSERQMNARSRRTFSQSLSTLRKFLFPFGKSPVMQVSIDVNKRFEVKAKTQYCSLVNVRTFGTDTSKPLKSRIMTKSNDSELDLVILDNLSKSALYRHAHHINNGLYEDIPHTSFIKGYKFSITSRYPIQLWADSQHVGSTPCVVGVIPKELRMIVGRRRMF